MTNGERAYGDLNDFDTDQTEFFQQYDEKYFSHSSLLGMLREGGLEQMSDLALRVFGLYQMSPRKFWGYDLSEEEIRCLMRQRERWSQRTYATGLMLAQLCKYIRQLEEQSLLASKDYAAMQLQLTQREKEEIRLRQKQKERELAQLAAEKRGLQNTILKQEQELRRLQKQAAGQKQQIAEQQTELGEMRSYLYSLSEGWEEGNAEAHAETKLSEWSEQKVLVVGGHTNWQNKLRELFPKWQFISAAGDTDSLFETKSGRGRKSKFKDVESQIVEEIERGNYQTLQQIADMVQEKFGINASIMAVSRFLKKRNPQAKGWLDTRQGRCCEAAQLL